MYECDNYLYVAAFNEFEAPLVKIGHTWRIDIRMRQLSKRYNQKIECLEHFRFTDGQAKYAEASIHKILKADNFHGEWFFKRQAFELVLDALKNKKFRGQQ